MRSLVLPLTLALTSLLPLPADACTTFCLRKDATAVLGKNYDWHFGDGLVVVNKRGVTKTAALPLPARAAKWTSQYGSVTFNQFGREFPNGGLNEAGLALDLMWLETTRYPAPAGRPAVDVLEWAQYQLDSYATVDEVVRHAGDLGIVSDGKVHFLVCDKGGSCATVEFLDGKPVIHTGDSLPAPALANHTYEESLRFQEATKGEDRSRAGQGSLQRFTRASARAETFHESGAGDPIRYAFDTLDDVAQGSFTQWSIVYDLKAGRVYWRTRQNRAVRSVALADFDLACAAPVKVLDIHEGDGEVARRFANYTPEANRRLVSSSYGKVRSVIPVRPEELEMTLAQPDRTVCGARQ